MSSIGLAESKRTSGQWLETVSPNRTTVREERVRPGQQEATAAWRPLSAEQPELPASPPICDFWPLACMKLDQGRLSGSGSTFTQPAAVHPADAQGPGAEPYALPQNDSGLSRRREGGNNPPPKKKERLSESIPHENKTLFLPLGGSGVTP